MPVIGLIAVTGGGRANAERLAAAWPLPPLPASVGNTGEYRILISDQVAAGDSRTAVLRPPSLVVGAHLAGLAAGYEVAADEVLRLADRALGEAGLSAASVAPPAAASEDGATGAGDGA